MKTYEPRTSRTRALATVIATLAVGIGMLEVVAGAMTHPDPDALAVRQRMISAQGEQAARIRALQHGELRVAATAADPRL